MKLVRGSNLEGDLDALFKLPLAEFTGARNALAARLKKSGRGDEAVVIKALAKPPVSAWAVNQLYWNHRVAFDRLIASGERFHKAQKSGKTADMRTALDARREALADLSDLATSLLGDSRHNPSLDTIRRISSTLEAMSAMSGRASRADAPRPGRLTEDVDPPGFESFGSFVPAAGVARTTKVPPRSTSSQKTNTVTTTARRKPAPGHDVRQLEEARKAKIAAARVALQDAKRSLSQARSRAQSLEAAQNKADAEAKKAEKQLRQAEESLVKAKAASEETVKRARRLADEVEDAASEVDGAELTVEKASRELEKLFGESSAR